MTVASRPKLPPRMTRASPSRPTALTVLPRDGPLGLVRSRLLYASGSYQSLHHSQIFPNDAYCSPSILAAFSHSASVGRRYRMPVCSESHLQKATASVQLTKTTGSSSFPSGY